ncbi:MAG: OmpA family protein [Flavobacteriales bacterium]|nr:OmpA family protein [Flavobacteriales bacterium]
MLQENPQMVISTIGYCDYLESDRSTLALARASKVRDMLIEKGVPPDQVEAQERGEQFRITKEQVATMKDPKEIEAAHDVNRYVNYIALRFDRKH